METLKSVSQKQQTDKLVDKGEKLLSLALYYMCGFILSGAGLFSVRIPLCTGLAAACTGADLLAVCAGSITGCFLRLQSADSLTCLIPLAGTAGLVFALEKLRLRTPKISFLCIAVFLFSFASSTVLMFAFEPSLNSFMLNLCAASLCSGSVTFYSGAVSCLKKKRNIYLLDNHSLICIMMSLCTLFLGSSEVSVFGFRPARLFGSFIILTASYLFSQAGGSIAGVSIGTCVAVSGTSVALSLCYGICGLASGIFSRYGQLACSVVFSGIAGVSALIDGSAEGVSVFAEAAVASLIFTAIPKKLLVGIRSDILRPQERKTVSEYNSAKDRILEASRAISHVSKCVRSVFDGIEALTPANDVIVCMRVKERVCADCCLKDSFCPENGEFAAVIEKLSQGESVSTEDFSENFNLKCPCVPKLADSFNRVYSSRNAVNALQAGAARNRELACSQFDSTATLLKELSLDVEKDATILHSKERIALRVLSDRDFEVTSVECSQTVSGALRLKCQVRDIPQSTSRGTLLYCIRHRQKQ